MANQKLSARGADIKSTIGVDSWFHVVNTPGGTPADGPIRGDVLALQLFGLLNAVPSRSGTAISFDTPSIYNTAASPGTGNITFDFTNAAANTEVCLFHHGSAPTFPGTATVIGAYAAGQDNFIRLIYRSGTEVDVTIQSANAGYTNPEVVKVLAGDLTTLLATATNITGLDFALAANSTYSIGGVLRLGCDNTGGVKLATTFPAGATEFINYLGTLNNSNPNSVVKTGNAVSGTLSTAMATLNHTAHQCWVGGTIRTAGTSGTLQFQYASTTAAQTSTVFQDGTFIKVTKVA